MQVLRVEDDPRGGCGFSLGGEAFTLWRRNRSGEGLGVRQRLALFGESWGCDSEGEAMYGHAPSLKAGTRIWHLKKLGLVCYTA